MRQHMKTLSANRFYYLLPALDWLVIITLLSLMRSPRLPDVGVSNTDKLAHAFVYFVLILLPIWGFLKKNNQKRLLHTTLWIIFASCCIYGVLIEVLQYSIGTGRNFEIPDIIANIVGCLFGVFLYNQSN